MRWTAWVLGAAAAGALTAGGAATRPLLAVDDVIENTDNGHWYKLVTSASPLDWTACETDAQKAGGYLASIDSDAENDWVWKYLVSNAAETFLGGSDAANEGTWTWSNGEAFTYSNWAKGEPDDQKGNQNYLIMGGPWSNAWRSSARRSAPRRPRAAASRPRSAARTK